MWKERLRRILIIIGVMILVLLAGKVFADWQKNKQARGESLSLPTRQVREKIEDIGEEILGTAIKVLPGSKDLKEKLESQEKKDEQGEVKGETKTETVKQMETQTQEIIKIIKELPAEQVNQIKKQVFKEFCQEVLKE